MFCPYCGSDNRADAITCQRCGEVLPERQRRDTSRTQRPATVSVPAVAEVPRSHDRQGAARAANTNRTAYIDPREAERELRKMASAGAATLLGRAKLVVEQGLLLGEQFLLADPEILIGRYDADSGFCPDIDLSAQDPNYVHRRHALLSFSPDGGTLLVRDLGGRNPVYVNNTRVVAGRDVGLGLRDKLRVGRVVMRLVAAPEMEGDAIRS